MFVDMDGLREIGWKTWDPLCLLKSGEDWREKRYSDEYDSYLLRAAQRAFGGASEGEVAAYLIGSAAERMGMGQSEPLVKSSVNTARAIIALIEDHRKTKA